MAIISRVRCVGGPFHGAVRYFDSFFANETTSVRVTINLNEVDNEFTRHYQTLSQALRDMFRENVYEWRHEIEDKDMAVVYHYESERDKEAMGYHRRQSPSYSESDEEYYVSGE